VYKLTCEELTEGKRRNVKEMKRDEKGFNIEGSKRECILGHFSLYHRIGAIKERMRLTGNLVELSTRAAIRSTIYTHFI